MIITAIKTDPVVPPKADLIDIFDRHLPCIKECSILAITSKIIAICEGRVVKIGTIKKQDLIEREADYFLPPNNSKYGITLTIKNNLLIPTAGIDESNSNGYYTLWPKDPQRTANAIRRYLRRRFSLCRVGVIITDSTSAPLRWGTRGVTIAHSGFLALKNYIGKSDLFGRKFKFTKANLADAFAAAAVGVIGEGNEQTPMAVIKNIPFVTFQNHDPSSQEQRALRIRLKDDLYFPLLKSVSWRKRRKGNK